MFILLYCGLESCVPVGRGIGIRNFSSTIRSLVARLRGGGLSGAGAGDDSVYLQEVRHRLDVTVGLVRLSLG